jgi:hypothetical protein
MNPKTGIPGLFERPLGTEIAQRPGSGALSDNKLPLQQIAERTLLDHYSPVGALVSEPATSSTCWAAPADTWNRPRARRA